MSGPDDAVLEFADVMRRLRAECPWKAAQTHRSLARYLLEETHETLEAIETGDVPHLREELGDLLLQVFLHTAIAEEAGDFTLGDVAAGATDKMVRRNPHVFGPDGGEDGAGDRAGDGLTPAEVNEEWERRKAVEKPSRSSVLDGLAPGLPALLLADKVLGRLERAAGRKDRERATLLLVPSPLLGPSVWRRVADWLRGAGHQVDVVDLGVGPRTPDAVVTAVQDAAAGRPVVLVPHSNAGLYAAHLTTLIDVRATVYVDAALPGLTPDVALAPWHLLELLGRLVGDDGVLPPWTTWWEDVDELFPDASSRAAVEVEQPRVPLSYFHHRLPVPAGWAAQPAAYLAFSDTYDEERARAVAAGWPVKTLAGGHLHQLHDPEAVGAAIGALLDAVGAGATELPPRTVAHPPPGTDIGERLLTLVADARADGVDPEQALREAVRRWVAEAGPDLGTP